MIQAASGPQTGRYPEGMNDDESKLEITVTGRTVHDDWRDDAHREWREKGSWSRMLGGGFVTSSKDPDDWEHPHLK